MQARRRVAGVPAAGRRRGRPTWIRTAAQRPEANKGGREEEKRSGRFEGEPTKLRSE